METLAALTAAINNAAVNLCEQFAVHSGVVSWGGGVVALPAPSGGGKSTITASLVKGGFEYVSDEALVFEDDATVVGYAKPLALTPWSRDVLGLEPHGSETLVTAADLGGEIDPGGRALTDIILSEFTTGTATMDSMARSDGLAALLRYSFNHYKSPENAWRIASLAASNARVWRLEYENPLDAAELMSSTLR